MSASRANAAHMAAPTLTPRRAEHTEVRHNLPSAASESEKLVGMLQELEGMMAASNKKNYELEMKALDAETPEEEMAVEREIAAFKKDRAELIGLRNTAQTRLDFITKPKANELVQTLMQLSQVNLPRQTGGQRDVIRGNVDALRQHRGLLGKRGELIATQQQLRKTLESGSFKGLPPAELKQIHDLVNLNIDKKLSQLTDLEAVVRQTERRLAAMGAGGLFNGMATTPRERERARQEELRRDQEALDNGYR